MQKTKKQPLTLYGVDINTYKALNTDSFRRAASFAATAHSGQKRLSGDPYIVHCIETAKIACALSSCLDDKSKADFVQAAVLHDVLEDTQIGTKSILFVFGSSQSMVYVVIHTTSETPD